MGDLGSYGLIFLDLVMGVAVLWIAVWIVVWAIKRVRRLGSPSAASFGDLKKRRCDTCGSSWWGTPGRDVSLLGLKIRRTIRKSRRGSKRHSWSWTSRQGWSRCPSCLSTEVRDSSDQEAAFVARKERRNARLAHSELAPGQPVASPPAAVRGSLPDQNSAPDREADLAQTPDQVRT